MFNRSRAVEKSNAQAEGVVVVFSIPRFTGSVLLTALCLSRWEISPAAQG
jgi:hypothetical protein